MLNWKNKKLEYYYSKVNDMFENKQREFWKSANFSLHAIYFLTEGNIVKRLI